MVLKNIIFIINIENSCAAYIIWKVYKLSFHGLSRFYQFTDT